MATKIARPKRNASDYPICTCNQLKVDIYSRPLKGTSDEFPRSQGRPTTAADLARPLCATWRISIRILQEAEHCRLESEDSGIRRPVLLRKEKTEPERVQPFYCFARRSPVPTPYIIETSNAILDPVATIV